MEKRVFLNGHPIEEVETWGKMEHRALTPDDVDGEWSPRLFDDLLVRENGDIVVSKWGTPLGKIVDGKAVWFTL